MATKRTDKFTVTIHFDEYSGKTQQREKFAFSETFETDKTASALDKMYTMLDNWCVKGYRKIIPDGLNPTADRAVDTPNRREGERVVMFHWITGIDLPK